MTLKCRICFEPWTLDSLHISVEEGLNASFDDARRAFYANGCEALGAPHGEYRSASKSMIITEMQNLYGATVDGYVSDMEDFGWSFLD